MFHDANNYILRTEIVDELTRYFVSFTDGQAIERETEVSKTVYEELLIMKKSDRNFLRWSERRIEQSEVSEETLYARALQKPISLEQEVIDSLQKEQLLIAISGLPQVQQRRFIEYHMLGNTYEQIAETEGCSFQAVAVSVKAAETAIKKYFLKQG